MPPHHRSPDLVRTDPYQGYAVTLNLWGIFYLHQEVSHAILGLLGVSPNLEQWRREMWDVYHSVYLLQRCPGSPSCKASRRRSAIQDILSSLQSRVQSRTYSAETKGPGAHGRERVGTKPLQSYEVALWATHQKALETTEALCNDLERLNNKHRGRSWVCSQNRSCCRAHSGSHCRAQSGSHPREWSRNQSRDQSRGQVSTHSESHPHTDHQCIWSQSLGKPQNRRVSFCDPEDEDLVMKEQNHPAEPSLDKLEMWLDYQARQLGTPMWWGELEAVPGIANLCKFAWKMRALFYVLEVWSRMFPEERYLCLQPPIAWTEGPTSQINLLTRM